MHLVTRGMNTKQTKACNGSMRMYYIAKAQWLKLSSRQRAAISLHAYIYIYCRAWQLHRMLCSLHVSYLTSIQRPALPSRGNFLSGYNNTVNQDHTLAVLLQVHAEYKLLFIDLMMPLFIISFNIEGSELWTFSRDILQNTTCTILQDGHLLQAFL